MSDLFVVPVRNGKMNMAQGFDVGAGPSVGIDDEISLLESAADGGEVDAELVRRVAWMANWEAIVLGRKPVSGWKRSDDETIATCDPKELTSIIDAMVKLEPHVTHPSWKKLLAFLRKCAKDRCERWLV